MLDDRGLELLNLEIDGDLSAADRAELSRRLLASSELRAARESLRRACSDLDRVPRVDPPAGLRARILKSVNVPATDRFGGILARGRWSGPGWRYAAVFAGGALFSLVAIEAGRGVPGTGVEQAAGTMAAARAPAGAPVATIPVDLPQVRGTVHLSPTADGLLVRLDVDARPPASPSSSGPVEMTVTRGGQEARLSGLGATQSAGAAGFSLVLPGPVSAGETVRLQFLVAGALVHEEQWRAPAGR
jgi:anti-sigma-K factor RskA